MQFELTAIAWYAVICGILSALAPSLGSMTTRLAIGGAVGILAATALPFVRSMMGGY